MRYTCDEPGFEAAFLEIDELRWMRRDVTVLFMGSESEEWFAVLRKHCTALHLPVLEGEPITKPADLTTEALDRLDIVLYGWLNGKLSLAAGAVGELAKNARRRSSNQSETMPAADSPTN